MSRGTPSAGWPPAARSIPTRRCCRSRSRPRCWPAPCAGSSTAPGCTPPRKLPPHLHAAVRAALVERYGQDAARDLGALQVLFVERVPAALVAQVEHTAQAVVVDERDADER